MLIFQHKSTLWVECLKLVNVIKSTFLGSEFHTECLVIKMKKKIKKFRPPSLFFTSLQQEAQEFF